MGNQALPASIRSAPATIKAPCAIGGMPIIRLAMAKSGISANSSALSSWDVVPLEGVPGMLQAPMADLESKLANEFPPAGIALQPCPSHAEDGPGPLDVSQTQAAVLPAPTVATSVESLAELDNKLAFSNEQPGPGTLAHACASTGPAILPAFLAEIPMESAGTAESNLALANER